MHCSSLLKIVLIRIVQKDLTCRLHAETEMYPVFWVERCHDFLVFLLGRRTWDLVRAEVSGAACQSSLIKDSSHVEAVGFASKASSLGLPETGLAPAKLSF